MAGDWIKMDSRLLDKPEVLRLAGLLGVDAFGVVGRLHSFWAWAERLTATGRIKDPNPDVICAHIDTQVARTNRFCDALIICGWLRKEPDAIVLPNFRRNNGKSAKARALARERMRRSRRNKRDADNRTSCALDKNRIDKRKKRERDNPPSPPLSFAERDIQEREKRKADLIAATLADAQAMEARR